jgi:protein-S-isoprenylcysteine O-methyltransferase Ste14
MASVPGRTGVDIGRVIMVPLAALMLLLDMHALVKADVLSRIGATAVLGWLSAALVCCFYALVIWAYLIRGPAVATTSSLPASAVAVVATFAPFAFPLLAGVAPGGIRQVAADALLASGTTLSIWSLRHLGRYLSVIAQARGVADRGPYGLVRHPLYTGELVSALGLTLLAGTTAAYGLWLALIAMQVYRARREERVLLEALPGYRDYRARTAALVPGLY